jgi:hypothetical protein
MVLNGLPWKSFQIAKKPEAYSIGHLSITYKNLDRSFNSENTASEPGRNAVKLPSELVVKETANNRDTSNDDEISNKYNNNKYNNNNNLVKNNDLVHNSNYSLLSPGPQSPIVSIDHQPNQIQLCSNLPYRHLKCDASDASDAPNNKVILNRKTKAQEVGLPEIPCMFCGYKDPLEFDLSLHYLEKHRSNLIRLPIGKSSIDDRADYAVELSKKKLFESLDEEDDGEADDDDLKDEDEGDE